MERKIHFFKIMVGDFEHRLLIPPAFSKFVKEGINEAILECPNERIWHVKLQKSPSGLYLQNGWEGFAKEHCLRKHDFLVFGYDGALNFSVKIYGLSACQKIDVCFKKTPDCNSYHESKEQATNKKRCLDSYQPSHRYHHITPRDERRNHQIRGVHLLRKSPTDDACRGSVPGLSVPQDDGHVKNKMKDDKRSATTEVNLGRQLPLDEAKGRAGDKFYFTSKLPYFVVRIARSSVSSGASLTIPAVFWKKHLPKVRMKILVQSPDGIQWEMSYVLSQKNENEICQARLCGGWLAFAQHHNLAAGDVCAFVLVDRNKMEAHIFHI